MCGKRCPMGFSNGKMGSFGLGVFILGFAAILFSAVYIADDLVFTKNGAKAAHPWMLMRIEDVVELFEGAFQTEGPLHVLYYRKRAE